MDIEDVHKNSKLLIDGVPYNVDEAEFVKPGKGRAIYRLKLRHLLGEGVIEHTFHSGEKVEEARVSTAEMQYLYREAEQQYVFMNTETFEQVFFSQSQLGEKSHFLKEGMIVTATILGDRPIDITLPNSVELEVIDTEVSSRKETVTAQQKSVLLETGHTIGAPAFVKKGDIIKVDTRTGAYLERVGAKK